jgi:integrase
MSTATYASHQFTRAAPYLFRNEAGTYYGKKKHQNKIHQESLGTSDYETAKRELKEFLKRVESKSTEKPDITFDDASKQWLEAQYGIKASSKLRRETSLNSMKAAFKGKKLRTITKHDLNVWAAKRSKEVSARTFKIDRETLVMLFEYAKKTLGVLHENHATDLPKMTARKAQVVPPTREQFAELVAFLDVSKRLNKEDKNRNAALFVRFLAYSGVRLEEARCVLWKHVDFDRGIMLVTGNATGTKNSSERTIPLFPALRALLEGFTKEDRKANSPVFDIYTAKEVLRTASKAIGLPKGEHFRHHDMRHFFCSNAIELLIPDHVIAAWLGHKDGGVLVKTTYGHLRKSFGDAEALKMTFSS